MEKAPCIVCAMRGTESKGDLVACPMGQTSVRVVMCEEHRGRIIRDERVGRVKSCLIVMDKHNDLADVLCVYTTNTKAIDVISAFNGPSTIRDAASRNRFFWTWQPTTGWTGGIGDSSHLSKPDITPVFQLIEGLAKDATENPLNWSWRSLATPQHPDVVRQRRAARGARRSSHHRNI